jgi:hypothetical protein
MERDCAYWRNLMTQIEARNIVNKKAQSVRQDKEVRLVYRGTAYKKLLTR